MHPRQFRRIPALIFGCLLLTTVSGIALASNSRDLAPVTIAIKDAGIPVELRLRVSIDRAGIASVRGVVREPGRTAPVLIATGDPAQAACADIDNDGAAGLTRLAAGFRETGTREPVRVVIEFLDDVDTSGIYQARVTIGESGMIGDIRTVIAAEPAPPPTDPW